MTRPETEAKTEKRKKAMQTITVEYQGNPETVNIEEQTAQVFSDIEAAHGGRFAFIAGHVSGEAGKKKCITPCVSNRWFLSHVRYDRYVERMIEAVEAVEMLTVVSRMHPDQFDKVRAYIEANDTTVEAFFTESKATVLSRLAGEDAMTAGNREGQAANCAYSNGWKLNLRSAKDPETGIKRPVRDNAGCMTVSSIALSFFEISKRDTPTAQYPGLHPAEYAPTNSRATTIMTDAIKRTAQSVGGVRQYKTFSISKRNYQHISLDGQTILGMVRDSETAELDAKLADFFRYVGELDAAPLQALMADVQATATATVNG